MSSKEVRETILAFGHENILATHPSTLMFTKEKHLSKTGDCIVAVAANKAAVDLNTEFIGAIRKNNARLLVSIEVDGLRAQLKAYGSQKLILSHPTDLVIRKSGFITDRTMAICADKSSADLSRVLVEKMKNPKQQIHVELVVC